MQGLENGSMPVTLLDAISMGVDWIDRPGPGGLGGSARVGVHIDTVSAARYITNHVGRKAYDHRCTGRA